jgi:hypothetical protein
MCVPPARQIPVRGSDTAICHIWSVTFLSNYRNAKDANESTEQGAFAFQSGRAAGMIAPRLCR